MGATGEMAPNFLEVNSKKTKGSGDRLQQRNYCWKTRKKFFTTKASKKWHWLCREDK